MIQRQLDMALIRKSLRRSPVVAILGPRQCGKTTLAREFVSAHSLNYFDLEDPGSLARLSEPNLASVRSKGWSSSMKSSGDRSCFPWSGQESPRRAVDSILAASLNKPLTGGR